jgi:hypothetical protein
VELRVMRMIFGLPAAGAEVAPIESRRTTRSAGQIRRNMQFSLPQ